MEKRGTDHLIHSELGQTVVSAQFQNVNSYLVRFVKMYFYFDGEVT